MPIDPNRQSTSQAAQSALTSGWAQQKRAEQMQPLNLQWNDNSTYGKVWSFLALSSNCLRSGLGQLLWCSIFDELISLHFANLL